MTIIIVNFNSSKLVSNQVTSLSNSDSVNRIVVVDNQSTDEDFKTLENLKSSKLILIKNETNQGFAAAVNQGIEKTLNLEKEGFLLLNPDLVISGEQIASLIKSAGEIISPVLKFQRHGEWFFDFGGLTNFLFGRTRHLESTSLEFNSTIQPDYFSGACLFIKKTVIEKIGLLNEKYFMYFEDADYCLRAKRAGFSLTLNREVVVEHKISEQKYRPDALKRKYILASNLQFIQTWIPWPQKILALICLYLSAKIQK